MRKQIAAANWKMNLTIDKAEALLDEINNAGIQLSDNQLAIFAVPFPYLQMAVASLKQPRFFAAAQNCYSKKSGAFTGETSVEMLQSLGVKYVIIGHSERREYFEEGNQFLAEKLNVALQHNITPVFCCGEPLSIREAQTQNSFVAKQVEESLFQFSEAEVKKIIIAYEPVWAIGTGKTATNAQVQEMHHYIRHLLAHKFGKETADAVSILYGGSVKAANAKEIFAEPDVDGGLVGGASLIASDFVTIIKSLK